MAQPNGCRRNLALRSLTDVTVVTLPAGEADALAARAAAVVAETVVSRPTQVLATLAVIMRHTRHPVLVLHLRMGAPMLVHGPFRPDVQPLLGGQPCDEDFLCEKKTENVVFERCSCDFMLRRIIPTRSA